MRQTDPLISALDDLQNTRCVGEGLNFLRDAGKREFGGVQRCEACPVGDVRRKGSAFDWRWMQSESCGDTGAIAGENQCSVPRVICPVEAGASHSTRLVNGLSMPMPRASDDSRDDLFAPPLRVEVFATYFVSRLRAYLSCMQTQATRGVGWIDEAECQEDFSYSATFQLQTLRRRARRHVIP